MVRCPYCGRELTKHERYCYHCEQDVGKAVDEGDKPTLPKPKPYELKKDFKKYSTLIKEILKKSKKTGISAYCVKCKKKVEIKEPKKYTMKNKMVAIRGVCPFCSTKVFRIIGKE